MVTLYNTGDSVLIPATIESAEEIDGKIFYIVKADLFDKIPEEAIVVNKDAQIQNAMKTFLDDFRVERWR